MARKKVEDRITLHRSREGTHEVTVSRVVETTECEKLRAVAPQSQKIGEFLEWLSEEKGISLCTLDRYDRYEPHVQRREELLAEYFDIDLDKVEQERRGILDALHESHANNRC
jgi:hypothetical protein